MRRIIRCWQISFTTQSSNYFCCGWQLFWIISFFWLLIHTQVQKWWTMGIASFVERTYASSSRLSIAYFSFNRVDTSDFGAASITFLPPFSHFKKVHEQRRTLKIWRSVFQRLTNAGPGYGGDQACFSAVLLLVSCSFWKVSTDTSATERSPS